MKELAVLKKSILSGTFPERGFATLKYTPSEEKLLNIHRQFDDLSSQIAVKYDDRFASLDEDISIFLKQSMGKWDFRKEHYPFLFKNLKNDTQKYKDITENYVRHDMTSFHYVNGVYDYLIKSKRTYIIPENALEFLRILQDQLGEIHSYMRSFIKEINKKVCCSTSIKIWKHTFGKEDKFLLPLHCDQSIFSLVVHTSDSAEQSLRIYPNRDYQNKDKVSGLKIPEIHKSPPLSKTDFPLIFPGWGAKTHFGIWPTPHYVEANGNSKNTRNSLIFFIGVS